MSIKKSFSLIEVLIFVTILSVFLIISAAVITVSMRQNTLRINSLKATHYSGQLLEWIRNEKEIDWNTIIKKDTSTGTTYCFNDEALSIWPTEGLCAAAEYGLAGAYKRYALIKNIGTPPSKIEVTIYTEWQEAGNNYSTKLHTVFSLWE